MMKNGFDPNLYMELQTKYIRERIQRFDNKLYLEFGGKLFDDLHAARVLPGFESDAKIKLLLELKDETEIIFAIAAPAIEKNKIRADVGMTYDMDLLRLIGSISPAGHPDQFRGHHPVFGPGFRPAVQEQAGIQRNPYLSAPAHEGLSYGCGDDPFRRRLWGESVYRDHQALGGGDRTRPRLWEAGHLPISDLS